MIENLSPSRRIAILESALLRIAHGVNAPDPDSNEHLPDLVDNMMALTDSYDCARLGYSIGIGEGRVWATEIAQTALGINQLKSKEVES